MQMNSEWNMKKEAGRNAGERKTVFSGTCLLQRSEIWKVRPVKPPAVRRQCPGCGTAKSIYESTGKFRVNANGSRLDVWLIYRCVRCKKSWNMEILERMETGRLSEEERLSYLENREEAALRAACSSPPRRLQQRSSEKEQGGGAVGNSGICGRKERFGGTCTGSEPDDRRRAYHPDSK